MNDDVADNLYGSDKLWFLWYHLLYYSIASKRLKTRQAFERFLVILWFEFLLVRFYQRSDPSAYIANDRALRSTVVV